MARIPWAGNGKPDFGVRASQNLLQLLTTTTADALALPQLVKSAEGFIPQAWKPKQSAPSAKTAADVPHPSAAAFLKQAHDAYICAETVVVVVSDCFQHGVEALAASDAELKDAALGCDAADGLQTPRDVEVLFLVAEGVGSIAAAGSTADR